MEIFWSTEQAYKVASFSQSTHNYKYFLMYNMMLLQIHIFKLCKSKLYPGCMNTVEVNGRIQDLSESEKQNKVVPGCGDGEQHDQGSHSRSVQGTLAPEQVRAAPKAQKSRGIVYMIVFHVVLLMFQVWDNHVYFFLLTSK